MPSWSDSNNSVKRASFLRRADISRKDGDAMDLVAAHHGVGDTVEVKHRGLTLQAHLDNPGPLAALKETRHRAFHELRSFTTAILHKLAKGPADNLLERRRHEIGKAAVDGANLAVERERQQHIIERVDQVAIALLGPGDDFE